MENFWFRASDHDLREMNGSNTLTLKKRKSIGSRIGVSGASIKSNTNAVLPPLNRGTTPPQMRKLDASLNSLNLNESALNIKLTNTDLKDLTLIELKYLKQICFNKLQKLFQQIQSEQQQMRKQLSYSGFLNVNSSIGSSTVRLTIPKGKLYSQIDLNKRFPNVFALLAQKKIPQ